MSTPPLTLPLDRFAVLSDIHGNLPALAVVYDWEQAAQLAEANQCPDWAQWLRSGRVE